MTSLLTCLTLFHGRDICRVEEAVEEVEEVLVTVMVGGDPLLQEVFYLGHNVVERKQGWWGRKFSFLIL